MVKIHDINNRDYSPNKRPICGVLLYTGEQNISICTDGDKFAETKTKLTKSTKCGLMVCVFLSTTLFTVSMEILLKYI